MDEPIEREYTVEASISISINAKSQADANEEARNTDLSEWGDFEITTEDE